jgi:indolepyruvate ferredoxin oxidoreductase alpha subunit
MGNEAVARGAIEAGVEVVAGYPGTPASEILSSIASVAHQFGIHCEWSTNEMVAFETAAGAALTGIRALAVMKHVGMNWCIDPLMAFNQTGVRGGFVLVVADDPGAYSSQNEQDSRRYAYMTELLMLEPSDINESKTAIHKAFEISETLELPVLVRLSSRICHSRADVELGHLEKQKRKSEFKRDRRWVMIAGKSPERHRWLHQQQAKILQIAEESGFNKLEEAGSKLGIIATGTTYAYVRDALRLLGLDRMTVLKIGTYPVPRNMIIQFIEKVDKALVFEEVEPVLEEQIKIISFDSGKKITILGKLTGDVQWERDLNIDAVAQSIAHAIGVEYRPLNEGQQAFVAESLNAVPPRSLLMCPGCPHLATYFVIHQAGRRCFNGKIVYSGDIGCYSLGYYAFDPPRQDTQYCMGSSIGVGCGLAHSGIEDIVVATIGDSTLIHAGIPALINAVYNNARMTVVIFDNETTAMTGFQPHPGTGVLATGENTKKVKIEDIVKACGVEYIKTIDPYDIKEAIEIVSAAMKYQGVSVIISRRQCMLEHLKKARRKRLEIESFQVDPKTCVGCKICVNEFGCAAITFDVKRKKANIDSVLCNGCGVCMQVCTAGSIHKA